jgi:tRNA nucleotidyltransferase (CCA-adding enzyme)
VHAIDSLLAQVPSDVLDICRRLRDKGRRGWIVGGCVRDLLRGRPAKDWDVATDARPEEVLGYFRKVIPTGLQHGTVTVLLRGVAYEVTTLRGEGAYSDGRRPDKVEFVSEIEADLARRDFTFNAIALDPVDGKIIDPFGGQRDLAANVLRAVGDADERFAEDGLRVLRAARFSATLECSIDPVTERAMASERALSTYRLVSAERIRDEWMKTMLARRPSIAFETMRHAGLLAITCPELLESVGCTQNQWHAFDVWGHTMACLDACQGGAVLRIAALLHDIGKPRSRAYSDKTQDYTFYDHEHIGAELAGPILQRLHFSNDERARIVALIRHHLICYSDDWSDAAVRRWLRRVTPELAPDLYALGKADALAKGRDAHEDTERLGRLEQRVEELLTQGAALSAKDLAIDGNDLIRELGVRPGRLIGEVLAALVELVTDEPSRNHREPLLDAARAEVAKRSE